MTAMDDKTLESELNNQICMVLLKKKVKLDVAAIRTLLAPYYGGDIEVQTPDGGGSMIVHPAGIPFALMMIPRPVPTDMLQSAVGYQRNKKTKLKSLAKHQAHLIISPLAKANDMQNAVNLSIHLTRVSALLAKLGIPVAAYWSNSGQLIEQDELSAHPSVLETAIKRREAGGEQCLLPVQYWVGFDLYKADGEQTVLSNGFRSFTGYELEIKSKKLTDLEKIKTMYFVLSYLFQNGPCLYDGSTLECDGLKYVVGLDNGLYFDCPRMVILENVVN